MSKWVFFIGLMLTISSCIGPCGCCDSPTPNYGYSITIKDSLGYGLVGPGRKYFHGSQLLRLDSSSFTYQSRTQIIEPIFDSSTVDTFYIFGFNLEMTGVEHVPLMLKLNDTLIDTLQYYISREPLCNFLEVDSLYIDGKKAPNTRYYIQ